MWGEYVAYETLMRRTEPGPGSYLPEEPWTDAIPRFRSIPNVSSGRLLRSRLILHDRLHTSAGLHAFDEPRRSLVNDGLRLKAIQHELKLRGYRTDNGCAFCDPREESV